MYRWWLKCNRTLYPFVEDESVALYGAEAAGHGLDTEEHAATFVKGRPGILHGALMNVLQDRHGQIMEAFSISAGLDYPGVGPEHCHFKISAVQPMIQLRMKKHLKHLCFCHDLKGLSQRLNQVMPLPLLKSG